MLCVFCTVVVVLFYFFALISSLLENSFFEKHSMRTSLNGKKKKTKAKKKRFSRCDCICFMYTQRKVVLNIIIGAHNSTHKSFIIVYTNCYCKFFERAREKNKTKERNSKLCLLLLPTAPYTEKKLMRIRNKNEIWDEKRNNNRKNKNEWWKKRKRCFFFKKKIVVYITIDLMNGYGKDFEKCYLVVYTNITQMCLLTNLVHSPHFLYTFRGFSVLLRVPFSTLLLLLRRHYFQVDSTFNFIFFLCVLVTCSHS